MKPYHTFTGKEFNDFYKGTRFYKFLNDDLIHYDFKYELGLNIDTKQFNPTGTCKGGGLYFCEESKCHLYWDDYGEVKLAIIGIPDDALVYIEERKFKADRLIINEIIGFEDVSDEFWKILARDDGSVLKYIKNQTYDDCRSAIKQNAFWIKYVRDQTEDLCLLAVEKKGLALLYITNQTERVCIAAIQQNSSAFEYVINPTDSIREVFVNETKNGSYNLYNHSSYTTYHLNQILGRIQRLDIQQIKPIIVYDTDSYATDRISKMFDLSQETISAASEQKLNI